MRLTMFVLPWQQFKQPTLVCFLLLQPLWLDGSVDSPHLSQLKWLDRLLGALVQLLWLTRLAQLEWLARQLG